MKSSFYVFLGCEFDRPPPINYQYLPHHLQKYGNVLCVEYPQFINLFKILTMRLSFIERKSIKLDILHYFGLLPFGRSIKTFNKINHLLNYRLSKKLFTDEDREKIIISFTPELILLNKKILSEPNIFYYVIDDFSNNPMWSSQLQQKQYNFLEDKMLSISKGVITSSIILFKKYKKLHHNVFYFSNPSDSLPFLRYKANINTIPQDLKKITKPIIGFAGSLYIWRVDLNLIDYITDSLNDYSFVFIGHLTKSDIYSYKKIFKKRNCHYLGFKNHIDLPKYIDHFDVSIIPYKLHNYGKACFPVKIYEHLAMGKPIVTTALPSIKHLSDQGIISWARNKIEFKNYILAELNKEKNNKIDIKKRLALENSWENRIQDFIKIIS